MSGSVIATFSPITPLQFKPRNYLSSSPLTGNVVSLSSRSSCASNVKLKMSSFQTSTKVNSDRKTEITCRAAAEYKFPDPIPEFAEAETEKFRAHLIDKLSQKDVYEDSVEEVVDVCTEIFSNFLLTEYGGPGTLLVVPFIDMADMVHERGLPGASQAARVAVKWAQTHVDKDWKDWTGTD